MQDICSCRQGDLVRLRRRCYAVPCFIIPCTDLFKSQTKIKNLLLLKDFFDG